MERRLGSEMIRQLAKMFLPAETTTLHRCATDRPFRQADSLGKELGRQLVKPERLQP